MAPTTAPVMKVKVCMKASSKNQAVEATVMVAIFAADLVASVKERIATAMEVPFPDLDLIFADKVLADDQNIVDTGIKRGATLDFVVKATEDTLAQQVTGLLARQTRPVSSEELANLYAQRHGASVRHALEMLGLGGTTLSDFLQLKAQAQRFSVDVDGRIQLSCKEKLTTVLEDARPTIASEQGVSIDCKAQRLRRLEAVLCCVHELTNIDMAIDEISKRAGLPALLLSDAEPKKVSHQNEANEFPSRQNTEWYKKESTKYPGKFYYVHATNGETSWKKPKDACIVAAPPPGLARPTHVGSRLLLPKDEPVMISLPKGAPVMPPLPKDTPSIVDFTLGA